MLEEALVRELLAAIDAGRIRRRDAMYALVCALPPSDIRDGLLELLVREQRQEDWRIRVAQSEMDLDDL
jgi:hypothetical protein